MKRISTHSYSAISYFIVVLLVLSLVFGCQSDNDTSRHLDSLSDAQLLPKPSETVDIYTGTSFINILSSGHQTNFPESLTFNMEIDSSHKITDIELRYQINKVTTASVITSITPDFTPENHVLASWSWDTRKSSLPPGAEINYQWFIMNTAGDELETELATFVFEDSRHNWNELFEANVRLLWYKGDTDFAQELMSAAQETLEMMAQDTGAELEKTVQLYIYANTKDLQDALIFPQEWTGGLAFTDYGIITIGISPSSLSWGKRTIAHELTHLVVRQMTYSPLSDLPTWLNEGLAMYAEGDLREDLEDSLEKALSKDSLFSIRSLGGSFPADPDEASLAYAQSYSIAVFLINNYGSEKMSELLGVFKKGTSYDDALLEVFGFDVDGLNTKWKNSL